jgi:hypothetical protein
MLSYSYDYDCSTVAGPLCYHPSSSSPVGATVPDANLFSVALAAALVTAAIEYPISQFYATVPPTQTPTRMAIAGGMAFVSVLVGGALLKMVSR